MSLSTGTDNPEPRGTSTNRIYKEIRQSILAGRYRPGQRLSTPGLAQDYGTSVTPVREALQRLSHEGLVAIKPHVGFFVAQLTLKQLGDMLDLCEILEVASVAWAAKRITKAQIEQLERTHARQAYGDGMAHHRRFHRLIAEAGGNQALIEMLTRLYDRLGSFHPVVDTRDEIKRSHRQIIDALRARDADAAKQIMRDELRESRERTLLNLIKKDGGFWSLGGGNYHGAA
ncbi:MAG: GntR family transcriptional regulator [Anaerolineae bacterium]|jgi:DNA-binding GntR family transcriptional regulator